jgi:hypothetical protein
MRRLGLVIAAAAALAALAPAGAQAGGGLAACELSPGQGLPPGGTPAYNLEVQRRGVPCRTAVAVMRGFHRCRTRTGTTCREPVERVWHCAGRSDRATPTMHGSFACSAPGGRRVRGTYWQEKRACFGAAARDPELPCRNDARTAVPQPGNDPDMSWVWPATEDPKGHMAFVGDSHTYHWAAALRTLIDADRLGATRLSQPGCFFNTQVGGFSQSCLDWYRGVIQWLRDHPIVTTLFVTASADTPVTVLAGQTYRDVKAEGFRQAFREVPPSVKHVIVLRDSTRSTQPALDCIDAAIAARTRRLEGLCPVPRAAALAQEVAIDAVKSMDDRRYSSIDLSRYLCRAASCYPVVGGVRTNADVWGHLYPSFTRTLGPYLLREYRRLQSTW